MSGGRVAVLIPARIASTRLPGKVLKDIHGKPLIQWVYEGSMGNHVDEIFVLTPDDEIIEAVETFGGKALKTGDHSTVLDRCAEGEKLLDGQGFSLFIVVQGDEPMVYPRMVDTIMEEYVLSDLPGICMYKEITKKEAENPNTVKCIIGNASPTFDLEFKYLSRSVIPGTTPEKDGKEAIRFHKQVCIMGFDPLLLRAYGREKQSSVELSEGIDLLRFIVNGLGRIQAIPSSFETQAVDTQEDLDKVRELLSNVRKK
jgi:3-deoxy-manno-octulosonate cytidylyltransferase (CMP-KDO synthetase)